MQDWLAAGTRNDIYLIPKRDVKDFYQGRIPQSQLTRRDVTNFLRNRARSFLFSFSLRETPHAVRRTEGDLYTILITVFLPVHRARSEHRQMSEVTMIKTRKRRGCNLVSGRGKTMNNGSSRGLYPCLRAFSSLLFPPRLAFSIFVAFLFIDAMGHMVA